MVIIKSEDEIEKMRKAGKILAEILHTLQKHIRPNITTVALDEVAENEFQKRGVISAFKGYRGFPAHICTSVNEEVVHGIPGERTLIEGDIVSIDIGIKSNDCYVDMAFTYPVGKIQSKLKQCIDITRESLMKGIKQARIDNTISDISYAIQTHAESSGLSVVRDFVGHGIGKNLHEEPQIPNFGRPHEGVSIEKGMVFAIEPMLNLGTWEVDILDNGWTAATKDLKPAFHFEHTIAVLKDGPQILTQ